MLGWDVSSVARRWGRAFGRGEEWLSPSETQLTLEQSDQPCEVKPFWGMLEQITTQALKVDLSAENSALRLASDLTEEEVARSAFIRNALILLRNTAANGGPRLIWRGSLPRATAAEIQAFPNWPGMAAAEHRRRKCLTRNSPRPVRLSCLGRTRLLR